MFPALLRDALRRWRRRPGLAIVATLILAIGIGATTAMYSIVDAVLLKAEPWPQSDRLVRLYGVLPEQRTNPAYRTTWNRSPIGWASWRDAQQLALFENVAAWVPDRQIVGDEHTELVRAFFASSTLPQIVGAQPALGRFFTADEDDVDSGTVIVSHRLWTRMFGADPDIIGTLTTVTPPGGSAANTSYRRTIIGVLPSSFTFPGDEPDVLLPIGLHKYNGSFETNRFLQVIGRLSPEATVGAAESATEPLIRRNDAPEKRTARVVTLRADRIGLGDQSLWLMLAGAALLLIVACSNVAGLLLSDAQSRRHETAVRLALGGSRGAVVRQLMSEHAVLAIAAGASGVLLASWLLPTLTALAPPGLLGHQPVVLDPTVASLGIVAAVITTMLAGLIPSTAISSTKPAAALKAGGRDASRGGRWRHRAVVAAQFSLALVLLVGAGLFGETLLRLGDRPLGFSPDGVAVVSVSRTRQVGASPMTPAEREELLHLRRTDIEAFSRQLYGAEFRPTQSLLDRLAAMPGVLAVGAANDVPLTSPPPPTFLVRSEHQSKDEAQRASRHHVSDGYFAAMGIPIVAGRDLQPTDRFQPVAVISQSLERRVFGRDAVGRRLLTERTASYEVIGVVPDVRQRDGSIAEAEAVYTALSTADSVRYIVVRTDGDVDAALPELRQAIESHDAPMFVTATTPLRDVVASTVAVERSRAMLSSMYGGVSLLLATVGLYGLAARLVVERRREIGIRVALGASRRNIRRLIMADAWMIVGIGLLVGLPTALVGSRLAEGLLYGVAPTALHVMGIAALCLTLAAITATVIPAWRANRIDPANALRED